MDYPFENLDPERFQNLCQALLTKEFPHVQCFPVAQPDGGRDALSYLAEDEERGFIVYQIKYVRRPFAETDPHRWLGEILKGEVPKLQKLIPKGAKQYILITNVPGTAHLDVGSIDKIHQLLKKELDVPAQCWWRDDLSRRLDHAWDLKWVYPVLMTGPDLIRSVIESGLSTCKERRSAAIRAYLINQFDTDQRVRFKQVEIDNRLLDLFIDVPVGQTSRATSRKRQYFYQKIHRDLAIAISQKHRTHKKDFTVEDPSSLFDSDLEFSPVRDERVTVGAAAMLLHPLVQQHIPFIVLEGMPGQGKSTITQYICQVHRMQILGKEQVELLIPEHCREEEAYEKLPEEHKSSSARLPFRVDLRDLATWLTKGDPFSADSYDEPHPKWHKSLESFLAAQIENDSGGLEFEVADLHAIAKLSSILLVLDGLDEVADMEKRREVVKEIIKGVNRLRVTAASLQVIITSRPAAFANSPIFPEDHYLYYHLKSITRPMIDEYARKWMKAKKLDVHQIKDVKKVLQEKLNQPHLRDLARNPMQLTILLSLIRRKTASLPDKRTALYDSYVELYFDREAEKNSIVSNHRELLIDINRYLAWILHVEAEAENGNGRITLEKLRTLLIDYLSTEGYKKSLVDDLLVCMIERVGALVSRVEGTYEFEVQPLREYFAAKHLYVTAPPSPPGNERPGTKPDRFDAMARNFYWLNVTRFYAGCYSKGELADLIDRLAELMEEEGYCLISYPRLLAAMLLSDWVFTQHPKSIRRIIEMILDGIGLRYLLTSNSRRLGSGNPLLLPKDCGQDELITCCFAILGDIPPKDYALDVIDLLKANAPDDEADNLWLGSVLAQKNGERTRWLEYGLYFGSLSKLSVTELGIVLSDDLSDISRIEILFKARRFDYLEMTESRFNISLEAILDGVFIGQDQPRLKSNLEILIGAFDAKRYALAFSCYYYPLSLFNIWQYERIDVNNKNVYIVPLAKETMKNTANYPILYKCDEILDLIDRESHHTTAEWAVEITPWDRLIEKSRGLFGEKWVFFHLANVAGGIKSKSETCKDFSQLFDCSVSLCRRARYARLRAGSVSYWRKLFEQATSLIDIMFIILLLMTWGSQKTLEQLASSIDIFLNTLSSQNWQCLYNSVEEAVLWTQQLNQRSIMFDIQLLPDVLHPRTVTLLGMRSRNSKDLYIKYISAYGGNDIHVWKYWQNIAIQLLGEGKINWTSALSTISQSYLNGVVSERYAYQKFIRKVSANPLPNDIAKEIAKKPHHYPGFLVAIAEAKCRDIVSAKIIKVGEIARKDKWFTNW